MFSGLEWYWWMVILAALILSIPFKVKFMNGGAGGSRKGKRGGMEMGG